MIYVKNIKALGFKHMHQMQIDALIDFVTTTVNLAVNTNDPDVMEEVEAQSDELIKLFGGHGLYMDRVAKSSIL